MVSVVVCRMRISVLLLASLVTLGYGAVLGCGTVEVPAADGGATFDAAHDASTSDPAFTLAIANGNVAVPLGGSNRLLVQVSRTGGFTGPITIAGMSPPSGVTVSPATVGADSTEGEILLAGAALTIGSTLSLTLEGTGEGVESQTVTLNDIPVTGQPGTLDTTFGPAGIATVSLGSDDNGGFRALDVVNGKVVGVGYAVAGLGAVTMLAMRFTETGVPDLTWNGGNVVRTSFGGSSGDTAPGNAVGRQNDGRAIAIGEHTTGGDDIAVTRYSESGGSGGVDFGDGTGKSLVNLGGSERVRDGLVLASNQIVTVGQKDGHFMVSRLTSSGLLDTSFGASGFVRTILGENSQAEAVALDTQNRILVVGSFATTAGQRDLVIRRYAEAGALDGAFGSSGVTITGPDSESGIAVAAQGDTIYVFSEAVTDSGKKLRVRRLLATGQPDESFGVLGLAETSVTGTTVSRDMAVLPDGRIVLLADVSGTGLLTRFTAAGELDTLFGTAGDGTQSLTIGNSGEPLSLAVYSPFRIVVGGGNQGGTPGPGTFALVARMWM